MSAAGVWGTLQPKTIRYVRWMGSKLKVIYAYEALKNAITVTNGSVSVSVYGTDEAGSGADDTGDCKGIGEEERLQLRGNSTLDKQGHKNGFLVG